jgi:hypothetical protein
MSRSSGGGGASAQAVDQGARDRRSRWNVSGAGIACDQLNAPAPETWTTSTMRDRDYQNFVCARAVVDAIGKARD